jgi:hypothetical protein
MANTSIAQRTTKAGNIARNGGIVKLANGRGFVAVDVVSGSGFGHITTVDSCDCNDRQFRGSVCKHMIAARTAQGLECCPTCGAVAVETVYYCGGAGYVPFVVCPNDMSHYGRKA